MLLDCARCGLIEWDHGCDCVDRPRCPECGNLVSTSGAMSVDGEAAVHTDTLAA